MDPRLTNLVRSLNRNSEVAEKGCVTSPSAPTIGPRIFFGFLIDSNHSATSVPTCAEPPLVFDVGGSVFWREQFPELLILHASERLGTPLLSSRSLLEAPRGRCGRPEQFRFDPTGNTTLL